jgi:hypothetical protein
MTRLSSNVFVQAEGESLYDACERAHPADASPHRFVHIVNPFAAPAGSEQWRIQELTFHTMQIALGAVAKGFVQIVATTYPGETINLPPSFHRLPRLARTVTDLGTFAVPRRLPLLFDIMELGISAAGEADTVILTNVDICLLPHFYGAVNRLLTLGFESLVINRRTIGNYGFDPKLLPVMMADPGRVHEGFDCFVFPRRLFDAFVKSDVCVGAPDVMRALLFNLVAVSRSLIILRDAHLTFHLGDDKAWARRELADYQEHNRRCAQQVIDRQSQDPERRQWLRGFCVAHGEAYAVP